MFSDRKTRVFWPACLLLFLVDCSSKELVVEQLGVHTPHRVLGDAVRFTLSYNPDAAMGLTLGSFSRVGFAIAAMLAIGVLASLYRKTSPSNTSRILALALVCGGAAGNLLDRFRSPRGVVDFIDVGVGVHRFYIFNLADAGVMCGAVALAFLLWHQDEARSPDSTTSRSS